MLNQPAQNACYEKMTTVEQYLDNRTVYYEDKLAIIMLKNEKAPWEDGITAE